MLWLSKLSFEAILPRFWYYFHIWSICFFKCYFHAGKNYPPILNAVVHRHAYHKIDKIPEMHRWPAILCENFSKPKSSWWQQKVLLVVVIIMKLFLRNLKVWKGLEVLYCILKTVKKWERKISFLLNQYQRSICGARDQIIQCDAFFKSIIVSIVRIVCHGSSRCFCQIQTFDTMILIMKILRYFYDISVLGLGFDLHFNECWFQFSQ